MSQPARWSAAANADRLEDLTFLADTGESLTGAASRLGLTTDALEKWCRTHGHQHLHARLTANTRTPGHGARPGRIPVA